MFIKYFWIRNACFHTYIFSMMVPKKLFLNNLHFLITYEEALKAYYFCPGQTRTLFSIRQLYCY